MQKRASQFKANSEAKDKLAALKARLGWTTGRIAEALETPRRTVEGWFSLDPRRIPPPSALVALRMIADAEARAGNQRKEKKP